MKYRNNDTVSQYRGNNICNVFDDTYFESGHTYEFVNQIKII